jgi:hypothetical protein
VDAGASFILAGQVIVCLVCLPGLHRPLDYADPKKLKLKHMMNGDG